MILSWAGRHSVAVASLSDIASQLRAAVDQLRPDELSQHAAQLRAATVPLLLQLASESGRWQISEAAGLVATAPDELEQAAAFYRQAVATTEAFMIERGMADLVVSAPKQTAARRPPEGAGPPAMIARGVDHGLIAEGLRRGLKISAEKVVRIGRDRSDRLVWLESGDDDAGAAHFLVPKRKAEFARADVAENDIVDLVWQAATQGEPVSISGTDRPVFETVFRGHTRRVAVTVGSNGAVSSWARILFPLTRD